MKMWRLCFLMLVCPGLCVAFGLGGCGDNPCEQAEPSTCARIVYAVPGDCLVVQEDDFACLCCTDDDGTLCDTPGIKLPDPPPPPAELHALQTEWDENSKTCVVAE